MSSLFGYSLSWALSIRLVFGGETRGAGRVSAGMHVFLCAPAYPYVCYIEREPVQHDHALYYLVAGYLALLCGIWLHYFYEEREPVMSEHMSEVTQLTQRFTEEYEAGKRGLENLSEGAARYDFIRQTMERMSHCHTQLIALVGKAQAGQILAEIGL